MMAASTGSALRAAETFILFHQGSEHRHQPRTQFKVPPASCQRLQVESLLERTLAESRSCSDLRRRHSATLQWHCTHIPVRRQGYGCARAQSSDTSNAEEVSARKGLANHHNEHQASQHGESQLTFSLRAAPRQITQLKSQMWRRLCCIGTFGEHCHIVNVVQQP